MKLLKDLYQYRELLKTNVKKDIRGKYKGSFLGILWSFINPLLTVTVYAIVFPYIMRAQPDNYLVYLVVGIIPWSFFTFVMFQGVSVMKFNAGVIKKVYFPRTILPISIALSGLVNFFISSIIMVLFCAFGGVGVSWHIIFTPVIAILQFFFSLGLVFIVSALNVYINDTEYIVQFVINLLFYGTPILYSTVMLGEVDKFITRFLALNPMTYFVNMYRDVFMYHYIPASSTILLVFCISFLSFFIGLLIFNKLEKGFAEVI